MLLLNKLLGTTSGRKTENHTSNLGHYVIFCVLYDFVTDWLNLPLSDTIPFIELFLLMNALCYSSVLKAQHTGQDYEISSFTYQTPLTTTTRRRISVGSFRVMCLMTEQREYDILTVWRKKLADTFS